MKNPFSNLSNQTSTSGFLPEDYLAKKAERRSNLVLLTLFFVVIFCVVGAFFVTNQQWSSVKTQQKMINIRYTQAAQQIEQLKELKAEEEQKNRKAELISALIEKAPRSVLLSQFINRMPERLTLLEVELSSKRAGVKKSKSKKRSSAKKGGTSLAKKSKSDDANGETSGPRPLRYNTTVTIVGVAVGHQEVAWYVSELQDCPLLEQVELKYSQNTIIDDRGLYKFRIEATLVANADARELTPIEDTGRSFGDTASLTEGLVIKSDASENEED